MPTNYIGRRVSIGVGKETTRGTAAAASFWEKQVTASVSDKAAVIKDDSAFGSNFDSTDAAVIERWGEFSLSMRVKINTVGLWLLNLFGSVASANHSGETTVKDHTFDLSESNQHQSLTLAVSDPDGGAQYANAMVEEAELKAEAGKFLEIDVKGRTMPSASASLTPAVSDETAFLVQHCSLKVAANAAGLSGATATPIQSFSVKVAQKLETIFSLGSVAPADILNTDTAVTGEIQALVKNAADFKAAFGNDTPRAVLLDAVRSDVTIGTAAHPELTVTLYRVKFGGYEPEFSLGKPVSVKVPFTAHLSVADGKAVRAVLTNGTFSY